MTCLAKARVWGLSAKNVGKMSETHLSVAMNSARPFDTDTLPSRWTLASVFALAVWIVPLVFPIILFVLVAQKGINVPFWDEWVWAKLIVDASHANPVPLLWNFQQNEHRVVFPSLIALIFSRFDGYNSLRQMLFGVALVALTQLTILRLIARTVAADVAPFVFFGASALLFGLAQSENWLWGFQFSWFFVNYLVIAMISLLTDSDLDWPRLAISAGVAFVACFSMAFGLASLPFALLCIATRGRAALRKLIAWIVFSIGTLILYFSTMPAAAILTTHPAVSFGMHLQYFLTYAGAPLCAWAGRDASASCGAVVLGCFIATGLVVAFARRRDALPWVAIAGYGLTCGVLVTYGRAFLGADEALAPRYVTTASMIWIGIAGMLGSGVWPVLAAHAGRVSRAFAPVLLAAFAIVFVPQERLGLDVMDETRVSRLAMLDDVRNFRFEPMKALEITYPSGLYVFDILRGLEHDGSASFLPKDCPRENRSS